MSISTLSERKLNAEELAAELERLKRFEPPRAKSWQPTMTLEEYFDARVAGRTREDIILKSFNNETDKLTKQLKEWDIPNWKAEQMEVEELAKGKKHELTITKEEYLQRRLAGEGRSKILKSLGGGMLNAYKLLDSWGIRELDAEERALELLAPTKPISEVDRRVAEQIERTAEAREAVCAEQPPVEVEAQEPAEQTPADGGERNLEQELANLQAAAALWRHNAESEREYRLKLEDELVKLREKLEQDNATTARIVEQEVEIQKRRDAEIERLTEALNNAAIAAERDGRHIRSLEEERLMLVRTIEAAAGDDTDGFVTLRLPILPASVANDERRRVYDAIEPFMAKVEAVDIDRGLVFGSLFEIIQSAICFIAADLAELLPGQDVSEYVQRFFRTHNDRHVESVTALQEAG